jgi:hypothetical protein
MGSGALPQGYPPEYGTPQYARVQQVPVYVPAPTARTSTTPLSAIALLIVSTLTLFTCLLTPAGIIGMIFGVIALILSSASYDRGRQMSIIGWVVFGSVTGLFALFYFLGAVLG